MKEVTLMKTNRVFTPTRIVALAVIGAFVLGLTYLRFAPGDSTVSVPAGAEGGDLTVHPCRYATEQGDMPADCGTLVVPENRADPDSRLIALPVIRIHARSLHPAEPIFRLEGGPGITNMTFPQASRYIHHRDLVLVGYRGVDGSSRLDCPEVESALKHSTNLLGEKSFRAFADGFRSCADRFTDDGVDLAGYGLAQQVDDLEAARVALGYGRINLLSESAGTRTAMIYSWRYPESIHRSVMVGVNPPGHLLWDAKTTDEQIGRYADLCSKDDSCRKRTDDLAASLRRTAADVPDHWFFLPIQEGNVRVTSFIGLMESTSEMAPLSAPITLDAWLSAAEGDASGFWLQSLLADLVLPEAFVWGQYAAAGLLDTQAARDYFSSGGQQGEVNLSRAATAFTWGGGRLTDAWPAAPDEGEYSRVRTSEVETLLVGGALDFSTPPQVATKELLPYLPNGHEVVLSGFGHTTSFWTDQPEAGSRLINTFFDSAQVDDSLYKPQSVDFTPQVTLTALAKRIAGTMVGFALLAVVSLALMALRLRRRGGTGRKTGACIRSLGPIVFGLGGWFLGALFVMTLWPSVSLDDQLLAVVSIGVPIWIGVYAGWVRPDTPTPIRANGVRDAGVGALVGAWLGFHATSGLMALVTAIIGAAVASNLCLLVLDIWTERRARSNATGVATDAPVLSPSGSEQPEVVLR
jgi:pimeloyl-ACP methyl ester carboxylesterase